MPEPLSGQSTSREVELARALWETWETLHTIKAALCAGDSLTYAEAIDARHRDLALESRRLLSGQSDTEEKR